MRIIYIAYYIIMCFIFIFVTFSYYKVLRHCKKDLYPTPSNDLLREHENDIRLGYYGLLAGGELRGKACK